MTGQGPKFSDTERQSHLLSGQHRAFEASEHLQSYPTAPTICEQARPRTFASLVQRQCRQVVDLGLRNTSEEYVAAAFGESLHVYMFATNKMPHGARSLPAWRVLASTVAWKGTPQVETCFEKVYKPNDRMVIHAELLATMKTSLPFASEQDSPCIVLMNSVRGVDALGVDALGA